MSVPFPAPVCHSRVLLLATTTGYQTRMFSEAASRLGVDLLYATDRCDQLDDPWRDGAIPIRFHEESRSIDAVLKALEARPIDGVLVVGDRPTIMAAHLSQLLRLPGHPPEAARVARNKELTRDRLRAAGLLVPGCFSVPATADPEGVLPRVTFPVVIKPTVLSASRGVIRADDPQGFVAAFQRLQRMLASPDVRELRDADADVIQIEDYIPGREYAVEGLMDHGEFRTLAVFDKPDPLDGPFFEETIYVTPSRATSLARHRVESAVALAAKALGLHHGPVHAECRLNDMGAYVLEVAARPIGGLCAKALRFDDGDHIIGLEELLVRHAIGASTSEWRRESRAAAVMMIPIARSGVFRGVCGVDDAKAVTGIEDVQITAKPDQQILALPEGASYLGFIFARCATPGEAEQAVRLAHARLRVQLDPLIEVTPAAT